MSSIAELEEQYTDRRFALAEAEREAELDESLAGDLSELRREVSEARARLDAALSKSGAGAKVSPPPKPTRDVESEITKLKVQIFDLGVKQRMARERKDQPILDKINKLIAIKQAELEKLESEDDEDAEIKVEIERLTSERDEAVTSYNAKIAALRARLRPSHKESKTAIDLSEDEHTQLRVGPMASARAEFKKLYKSDPSVGIDGTATGMVKVRPARPDRA